MKLEGIDHVAISVPDIARTTAWYREVLGFERLHADEWGDEPAFIGIGSTALALFAGGSAGASDGPMLHLAFRATGSEFVRAKNELSARAIALHFEDHGIAHSIYFRDLNGLRLEITTYDIE